MQNYYEMTYILSPVLEDETVKEKIQMVNGWLESNGGTLDQVDEWGLTKFATPIDGKSNGYYVNMYFTAPAGAIQVLERNMRINDEFLRYMTLKYDAKMMRHRELQKKNEVPSIFTTTTESKE